MRRCHELHRYVQSLKLWLVLRGIAIVLPLVSLPLDSNLQQSKHVLHWFALTCVALVILPCNSLALTSLALVSLP